MDEHLDGLHNLCHPVLKRLKMDETGTIQCSKEFPREEVSLYVQAYGLHKKKWFEARYDKPTDTVRATRGEPPPWEIPEEIDTEEEP